jgi:agmatine deiminase
MSLNHVHLFPEWAPQEAIWVGWPCVQEYWGEAFDGACEEIAVFVRTLAQRVNVNLGVRSQADAALARRACGAGCDIHIFPMGDIWFRDTGPIFAEVDGVPTGLRFGFNGWGGKFVMPGDEATGQAILDVSGQRSRSYDFILEGGAVDVDGGGRLLTTRACMLNTNRNIWSEVEAEIALRSAFGVDQIIWLDKGLLGDHTDGHVDNVARFIGPNRVVSQHSSGPNDPNAPCFVAIEQDLKTANLSVIFIPSPGEVHAPDGTLMAASHLNFVFANGLIIMPRYEPNYSEQARAQLAKALPDFEIILLDANHILTGGGSFHCISQPVPRMARR